MDYLVINMDLTKHEELLAMPNLIDAVSRLDANSFGTSTSAVIAQQKLVEILELATKEVNFGYERIYAINESKEHNSGMCIHLKSLKKHCDHCFNQLPF